MRKYLRDAARKQGGERIPGGCENCNAYQVLKEDPESDGVFHCLVYHDDWCPTLRGMR